MIEREPATERPVLVRSAADGSFEAFFRAAHGPIVRALALALGDPELGHDAAAEAFTRALDRWGSVRDYTNPSGWVYRVGLNWGRSRLRKLRRELDSGDTDSLPEPPTAELVVDPTLVAALRSLSVDHRAVVVGRFYLDWSEAEVAHALDIPVGTVKSRLHRALHHLAERLEARDA